MKNEDIILQLRNINVSEIADSILNMHKFNYGKKDVVIENRISKDLPLVYADRDRVVQIMHNLVGNAFKFTEKGIVYITAVQKDNMLEISVVDTGIGIPSEKINSIFKSFVQVDSSITRSYGGAGIGLSITKTLVEALGGQIRVESELEKGSCFTFSLPVSVNQKNGQDIETVFNGPHVFNIYEEDIGNTKFDESTATVLICDDDLISRQVLKAALKINRYNIITADNAEKMFEILENENAPDLLILDVMMPKISGYEALKKIRERFKLSELPVLLLTARNRDEDIVNGLSSGANDFLSKPFVVSELLARTETLISLKRTVSALVNAQLSFLRAQIKPHFLHNALNTIIYTSRSDIKKAQSLLLDFSDFLRGSFDFDNNEEYVTFQRELELIKAYLSIEKARFGERLKIQYDLRRQDFYLPPFILQPLVENAVLHGIMEKVEGGMVKISAEMKGKYILISVFDTGVGMTQEKLEQIFEQRPGENIGLNNINARLMKYYGHRLEIESITGIGTNITVRIPEVLTYDKSNNCR